MGKRSCIEALFALTGLGLLALALLADRSWFDQHVLPQILVTREFQVGWWRAERSLVALLGLVLVIWTRRWAGRQVQQGRGREIAIRCTLILGAILLSGLASEYLLRHLARHKVEPWSVREEPLRQGDAHLGWKNVPARTGSEMFGGMAIAYHLDANGYRIAAPNRPVDHDQRSIV